MASRVSKAETERDRERFELIQLTCDTFLPLRSFGQSLSWPQSNSKGCWEVYVATDMWEVSIGSTATNVPNFPGFHKEEFILNSKVCLSPMPHRPVGRGATRLLGIYGRRSQAY